jgi:hypothetical protein
LPNSLAGSQTFGTLWQSWREHFLIVTHLEMYTDLWLSTGTKDYHTWIHFFIIIIIFFFFQDTQERLMNSSLWLTPKLPICSLRWRTRCKEPEREKKNSLAASARDDDVFSAPILPNCPAACACVRVVGVEGPTIMCPISESDFSLSF